MTQLGRGGPQVGQVDKGLSGFEVLPCPLHLKKSSDKMTRAADGCLLLERDDMRSGDDDFVHWHLEQSAQCVEIIYAGKTLPSLPFVDGLRLLKSEIVLEISDCQAAILSEPANIRPSGHRIDHRELNHGHMDRLHSSG